MNKLYRKVLVNLVLNECGVLPLAWKIEPVNVPASATPVEAFDDYRGLTENEAMPLIAPMVNEMFGAQEQYGRPIMCELAAYRGKYA